MSEHLPADFPSLEGADDTAGHEHPTGLTDRHTSVAMSMFGFGVSNADFPDVHHQRLH